MKKSTCRRIALLMLIFAAGFVWYALHHPEMGLPLRVSHNVMMGIYSAYVGAMVGLFIAPGAKKEKEEKEK